MMKTFILAPDSFKESMTAEQACVEASMSTPETLVEIIFTNVKK